MLGLSFLPCGVCIWGQCRGTSRAQRQGAWPGPAQRWGSATWARRQRERWEWRVGGPSPQGPRCLWGLTPWLQLLGSLETENKRLEAALRWRRRELVFWQWMVRRPHPTPPHLDRSSPGVVGGSAHLPDRKRGFRKAMHSPKASLHPGLLLRVGPFPRLPNLCPTCPALRGFGLPEVWPLCLQACWVTWGWALPLGPCVTRPCCWGAGPVAMAVAAQPLSWVSAGHGLGRLSPGGLTAIVPAPNP